MTLTFSSQWGRPPPPATGPVRLCVLEGAAAPRQQRKPLLLPHSRFRHPKDKPFQYSQGCRNFASWGDTMEEWCESGEDRGVDKAFCRRDARWQELMSLPTLKASSSIYSNGAGNAGVNQTGHPVGPKITSGGHGLTRPHPTSVQRTRMPLMHDMTSAWHHNA